MDIHDTEAKVPAVSDTPAALLAAQSWRGVVVDERGFYSWAAGSRRHPRNWKLVRKIDDTGMIMFIESFTTVISTASANAGHAASKQLGLSHSVETLLFMTLYLTGQCIGGVVLPSYSESFGRKWLYTSSALIYSAFSVLIAAWPTSPGIAVGRFITGFVSAVPSVVISGSLEDIWNIRARIWVFFIGATICNMGLVVGPIISPYIIDAYGWECIFYISAIVCGVSTVLLAFMRESRPSTILRGIVKQLRAEFGEDGVFLVTSSPDDIPDFRAFLHTSIGRPLQLLFTEWITFTVAILAGVAIALVYLFAEIMPTIFEAYDPPLSQTEKVMPWLCLAAGFLLGCVTRICDHMRLRHRCTRDIHSEDKLLGFVLAAPSLAVGLWWFAWTVPPSAGSGLTWTIPWPVAAVSLVPVGWALNEFDMVLGGYITDTYQAYAASAFGAMNLVRSILSATFPLLATVLYNGLGYHWAGTLLAACATLFCIVPVVFVRYGARIRKRSKFAMWSADASKAESVER
ncbi:putative MFS multidrug transporter [Teratosphaeria nubilosa]|uniref:Putative MFS multidrug transporter n=1 Tax=Teratosphaeria nubilosa TaxID=161662 RepID=A0A6G1L356_9PEZI|nr:putative MFS multidrug transporter [Teratosphaeria nubilosa]